MSLFENDRKDASILEWFDNLEQIWECTKYTFLCIFPIILNQNSNKMFILGANFFNWWRW